MFDDIPGGLNSFYEKTGVQLSEQRINVTKVKDHNLSQEEIDILIENLQPEYTFYNKVRSFYGLEIS